MSEHMFGICEPLLGRKQGMSGRPMDHFWSREDRQSHSLRQVPLREY